MWRVGRSGIWPASIRLVDNMQFQFAAIALKTESGSKWKDFIDKAKKYFVVHIKGFDPEKMCAATLLFEGTTEEVTRQEKFIYKLASLFGGIKAGPDNGIRGYFLTFVIAYLRDFVLNF